MSSSPTSSSEVYVFAATPQFQVLSLWESPSPSPEQLSQQVETGSFRLSPSPPYRPLPTRSIKENALFQHFGCKFIPLLFRTTAHPGFLSVSDIYITAANHPWMMDIFLGLAALHLSQGSSELQSVAHQYYYTAIRNLRQNIETGCTQGTEDWMLVATIFMYLFEQWRSSASCNIMHHLEGAAQILRLRKERGVALIPYASRQSPVNRIAAESFMYHVATVTLFFDKIDHLCNKFSWADLEDGLRSNPFPHASEDANSPIMGLSTTIYRLAFDVTRLSRHTPLQQLDRLQALDYKQELDALKATLSPLPPSPSSSCRSTITIGLQNAGRLYIIALHIFLLKLLVPEITSKHPRVTMLAQEAIQLIQSGLFDDFGMFSKTYPCWPLTILACAAQSSAHVLLLKDKLMALWKGSLCGQFRRTALVIDQIWEWRAPHQRQQQQRQRENVDHDVASGICCQDDDLIGDGLDLLTQGRGLMDLFNIT